MRKVLCSSCGVEFWEAGDAKSTVFVEWNRDLGGWRGEKYCIRRVELSSGRLEMRKVLCSYSGIEFWEAGDAKTGVFVEWNTIPGR